MIVPRVRTVLTRAEIRSALLVGHREAFGYEPSDERLGMATIQAWGETANGKGLWCFNFGNVDALPEWDGDTFELTAREVLNGRDVMVTKQLCAFSSAAEGAAHQWRRLRDNYPTAFATFDDGDPVASAAALKAARYYTATQASYTKLMVDLSREYALAFPAQTYSPTQEAP